MWSRGSDRLCSPSPALHSPLTPAFSLLTDEQCACVLSHFSRVRLFVTPWTVIHQAPLSMGFSRQEYQSGWHFLLQGTFLTKRSNLHLPRLLHCRRVHYHWATRFNPELPLDCPCFNPEFQLPLHFNKHIPMERTHFMASFVLEEGRVSQPQHCRGFGLDDPLFWGERRAVLWF